MSAVGRRTVTAVALLAGVLVLAGGGVAGWLLLQRSSYTHDLESYPADEGAPNRLLPLDDGEARLAYGSPDRHRYVVQWRDPDGSGWSEPTTVLSEGAAVGGHSVARAAGGTVAIRQSWSADGSDEGKDAYDATLVCRDLTCRHGPDLDVLGPAPQLTPDGRTVLFGETRTAAVVWTAERGFAEWPWSGHPGLRPRGLAVSPAQLGTDGSLRIVTAPNTPGRCTFTLLVSEPGTADLRTVATVTRRMRAKEQSCGSYLGGQNADRVRVRADATGRVVAELVREGEVWAAVPRKG